ncbi:MAG TPA: SAV_6107 family HEPN domain-containing protein [Mycobacteriales bacterium]|nr:SAV_6107 family HEPN domain-containing protein [Mycobacteriales bacterium]
MTQTLMERAVVERPSVNDPGTTSTAQPTPLRRTAIPASALRLVVAARRALGEAEQATDVGERYAAAHLSALRAAAGILAADARPDSDRPLRRGRPTSVWTLLDRVAPDLGEWAAYFSAGADKRIAAQAGMRGAVTTREADDLVRDAGLFVDIVAGRLGMPRMGQAMLPLGMAPAYPVSVTA